MSKRNLSYDDGMMIWKTREAYRVQSVLLAVFYFPQFLFALFGISYLYRGLWAAAASMVLAIALFWAARWALGTGLPWLVRWGGAGLP